MLADIRTRLSQVPGVVYNIGQPISHRLDHIMSGIRADRREAVRRGFAGAARKTRKSSASWKTCRASSICRSNRKSKSRKSALPCCARTRCATGLAPADVAEAAETALQRRKVSQVLEGQRTFDLVVWFDAKSRNDIEVVRFHAPHHSLGRALSLGTVAEVLQTTGPNTINRENVVRRVVVMANVAGRDLVGVVHEIEEKVSAKVLPTLPQGYFVEYGGQFERSKKRTCGC